MTESSTDLKKRLGYFPKEDPAKLRARIHQGWWRVNVLNMDQGNHPTIADKEVCSSINDQGREGLNFLTPNIIEIVNTTLADRASYAPGEIKTERLFNNLLSSQPACFNFFGELAFDLDFGLRVLQSFWPEITQLHNVIFEYAPTEWSRRDGSAFDIAFEVSIGDKMGLIGLECKYTDTFSISEFDKKLYRELYACSNSFKGDYKTLKSTRFNQLFRNQLMAEYGVQNQLYDFVYTGLFCYEEDTDAQTIGHEFSELLSVKTFKTITFKDYIEKIQQLNLTWKQREWTMNLWARYCALSLSESTFNAIK